jgi:hypothetical protein
MKFVNLAAIVVIGLMVTGVAMFPFVCGEDAAPVAQNVWMYCHFYTQVNETMPGGMFIDVLGYMDTAFPKKDANLADTTTGVPGPATTMYFPIKPTLSGDLKLDKTQDCVVNVYLSPAVTGTAPGGYAPQEHVSVKLMSGQNVIGSGEQTQDVGPAAPPSAPPGTKFEIKFKPSVDTIAAKDNIVLSVTVDTGGSGMTSGQSTFATGKENPWGVSLPLLNPIEMETSCYFESNSIVVSSVLSSPFGIKDIDAKSINVSVVGSTIPIKVNMTQSTTALNGTNATQIKWVWKYKEDNAKSGEYEVKVSAADLQKIAVSESAKFTITETGGHTGGTETPDRETEEKTPGFEFAVLLGAIGAVAVCLRRKY